jgi:hypothetical protein
MTAVGLVLAVRMMAGVLLALAARLPGQAGACAARSSRWLTPGLARRLVDVIVGVSLTSGTGIALTAPAYAAALAAPQPAATSAGVVPAPVLAPPEAHLQTWPDLGRPGTEVPTPAAPDLTSPARPRSSRSSHSQPVTTSPRGRATATAPRVAGPAQTTEIVVAPGDCLWTLARRDLDERSATVPSVSEVATAAQHWWQANRSTIGSNPDRLLPGQRLRSPG